MTERPIIFSAPMVRAILSGAKTQTRRVVKPQPIDYQYPHEVVNHYGDWKGRSFKIKRSAPYGSVGDRLWVRETFRYAHVDTRPYVPGGPECFYRADGHADVANWPWRSPIHMPRLASRITLEIAGVRGERLQDITEEDAKAEGVDPWYEADLQPYGELRPSPSQKYRAGFMSLWAGINGIGSWADNPWVWVIEFRRVK